MNWRCRLGNHDYGPLVPDSDEEIRRSRGGQWYNGNAQRVCKRCGKIVRYLIPRRVREWFDGSRAGEGPGDFDIQSRSRIGPL